MKVKISYESKLPSDNAFVLTNALKITEEIRTAVLSTGADAIIAPLRDSSGSVVGRISVEVGI